MKTEKAVLLHRALTALAARPAPHKFAYAAGLMLDRLEPIDKAFRKATAGLLEQYGEKDEAGKLKVDEKTNTHPLADAKAFNDAVADLQAEEVDVKVHQVALENFPAEIEPALMVALLPMVQAPPEGN